MRVKSLATSSRRNQSYSMMFVNIHGAKLDWICVVFKVILNLSVSITTECIEVGRLTTITSMMVIKLLNEWFSRHGIPEKMVSYDGRQTPGSSGSL